MRLSTFLIPFLARAGGGVGGGGSHSSGSSHISSSGVSHISSTGFTHTYVGGGGVTSSSTSGGLAVLLVFVPIVLFVLLFAIIAHRAHQRAKRATSSAAGAVPTALGGAALQGAMGMPPSADGEEERSDAVEAGLSAIREHDADFDEDAFVAEAERTFFAVEEAWNQQRPELSRPVMSEDAWEHQKTEIERYRSSGRRNVLENLTVAKATILDARSEDGHDVITVRFRAASANYDVEAASGKVVHGNHQMAFWEQDWVFQRSSGATSDQGSTIGQGSTNGHRCPNCGAPLDLDIAGVCKNCKVPVRAGDNAWVVVRADQPQHVPG